MCKLIFALITLLSISVASSLDMSTLRCREMLLTTDSTLSDVHTHCVIKKEQYTSTGRFQVNLVNTTTDDTVECYFASNSPKAKLNSCK